MDEYSNLDELKNDFRRLLDNALKYYDEDSDERKAASELEQMYNKALEKITAGQSKGFFIRPLIIGEKNQSSLNLQQSSLIRRALRRLLSSLMSNFWPVRYG